MIASMQTNRPAVSEVRQWLQETAELDSDQATLTLLEHLEESGLSLEDLELVTNADKFWNQRAGRSEKEQRAVFLLSRKVGTKTRCYFVVEQ